MPDLATLEATPASAPRPRRKGEETAERILDVAGSLFAEHGYSGTTLRDVANGVGIRNPSLYNHFPSKESLYAAVLERGIAPIMESLTEFVLSDDADHGSRELVERVMGLLAQRPELPLLILHETLSGGQRLSPVLREWIGPAFEKADQATARNVAGTRWSPEQVPLLVIAMYNVVLGYFTIAPLYAALRDEELMSASAIESQTRFLADLVETLFAPSTR